MTIYIWCLSCEQAVASEAAAGDGFTPDELRAMHRHQGLVRISEAQFLSFTRPVAS